MSKRTISKRLEYLRGELRAERISLAELVELQGLAPHIAPDDVELLAAAGVPEHKPVNSARWCPLCGTVHGVAKGAPSPWTPHVTRNQIEALPALILSAQAMRDGWGKNLTKPMQKLMAALEQAEGGKR